MKGVILAKEKESTMKESQATPPKELTAEEVLIRVLGVGQAEATSLVDGYKLDRSKVVAAYKVSAAAVQTVIDEAADALVAAKQPKPAQWPKQ